jgi:hypothetical protein
MHDKGIRQAKGLIVIASVEQTTYTALSETLPHCTGPLMQG